MLPRIPRKAEITPEKKEKGTTTEILKARIGRLESLVSNFLEDKFDRKDLLSNPEEIDHLRKLLEENLWDKNISPYDPHWETESNRPEESVSVIIYFHEVLKNFWESFKKEISVFQKLQRERENIRTLKDAKKVTRSLKTGRLKGMEEFADQYFSEVHRERDYFIDLKMPEKLDVHYSLETGSIHFFQSGVDAIHAFIGLLQGLPIDIFKKCKDEKCGCWFILTSKHRREFCNHLCAARYTERVRREKNRKRFNKYHRVYYQENYRRPRPSEKERGSSHETK